MKLLSLAVFCLAILALSLGKPTRRTKFNRGDSGSSGRAGGDITSVDTESKVQAGSETEVFAESRGVGAAHGGEESAVDLESWAGVEGLESAGAGGGVRAVGDETAVDTDSEVFVNEIGARAKSGSRGGARGVGESAVDLESFSGIDDLTSGSAGGGGRAIGDESDVESGSSAHSELNFGTLTKARSRGAALGTGRLASVKLENFAGIDETETEGKASATAIGNVASGKTGVCTFRAADGTIQVCSESEANSEANRRGGIRTGAEANDEGFGVEAASEARGEAEVVITGGSSKTGLTNEKSAGKADSFANANGQGSSFGESAASVDIGDKTPEALDQPETTTQPDTPEICDEEK